MLNENEKFRGEDIAFNELEVCSYRHLQSVAKKMGLPSNVKKVNLIEMIRAKKYCSEAKVQEIVDRIKMERKINAQAKKKKQTRRTSKLQGTEGSSTSSSQSPPITLTPKRPSDFIMEYSPDINQTIMKYQPRTSIFHAGTVIQPLKRRKSDRVLRSFNSMTRPNYRSMEQNSCIYGVVKAKNTVRELRQENQQEIRQESTYQRVNLTIKKHAPILNAVALNNDRHLVPILRSANTGPKPAKRQRKLSGIYPIQPCKKPYYSGPTVTIRQNDGRVAKINAIIQRPLATSLLPKNRSITPKRVLGNNRPIVVTVQDVINYKVDHPAVDAADLTSQAIEASKICDIDQSKSEQSQWNSIDFEEDKTYDFETTEDKVESANSYQGIEYFTHKPAGPLHSISQRDPNLTRKVYTNRQVANNDRTTWNYPIDYRENEDDTRHEWSVYDINGQSLVNPEPRYSYKSQCYSHKLKQNKPISTNYKVKQGAITEPVSRDNKEMPGRDVELARNTAVARKIDSANDADCARNASRTRNIGRVKDTDCARNASNAQNKDNVRIVDDARNLDHARNIDSQNMDNTRTIESPRNASDEDYARNASHARNTDNARSLDHARNIDSRNMYNARNMDYTINMEEAMNIDNTRLDNETNMSHDRNIDYARNADDARSTDSVNIDYSRNMDYARTDINANSEYPYMTSLAQEYPNTDFSQEQTEKKSEFSIYYHKKIRGDQVRTNGRDCKKLPGINDAFSQFNDVKYRDLSQPLFVKVSEESERVPMLMHRNSIDSTCLLESMYNFKNQFLTNPPVLQIATTNQTTCTYTMNTVATAASQPVGGECCNNDQLANSYQPFDSEYAPGYYDYIKPEDAACTNFACDEVMSSSTVSIDTANSQELGANVTIPEMVEDALELISQDGDYMEQIGMDVRVQCVICKWAGPKIILEYHIRKEHYQHIQHQNGNDWSILLTLGDLMSRPTWCTQLIQHGDIMYAISAKYNDTDTILLSLSMITAEKEEKKRGRITVYNKISGKPYTFEDVIKPIPVSMPYEYGLDCLVVDIGNLDLIPNSANLKLVNRELVGSPAKVVVGQIEMNRVELVAYVKLMD